MAPTPDTPLPATFWRCGACGTPNPTAAYVARCLGCGRPRPKNPKPVAEALAPTTARGFRPRRTTVFSWVYAAFVLLLLVLVRWVGNGWWGVTLLLFLPRGVFLLPVVALAVASGLSRAFGDWVVQGATALVAAGPLMGLSLPLQSLWDRPPSSGQSVRLVTFNLGLDGIDVAAFRRWIDRERVDILCLQEGQPDDPTREALAADGWNLNRRGSIASRFTIVEELTPLSDEFDTEGRFSSHVDRARLRTPSGRELLVVSLHLPTLRPGFERFLRGNVGGLKLHVAWWAKEMGRTLVLLAGRSELPMLVGGDFNMPADDSTMAALRGNFRFAFEEAGWGYGYTRPARFPWVRIDHALASPEWSVAGCRTGPDFGSDHLPLRAELVLPSPTARP